MALTSWPRAFFEVPRGGARTAAKKLAVSATQALRAHYHSAEMNRLWPASLWFIIVGHNDGKVVVVIRAYKDNGVVVHVDALHGWSLIALVMGSEQPITVELRDVCVKIHSLLQTNCEAIGLRWYVKGASESVATPVELPW